MKVYIAGKITGDPDYKKKFAAAARSLENAGLAVLIPSVLPEGMTPADYMRICVAMIDTADLVVFLDDYQQSKGAMLEHAWCEYTGKEYICVKLADLITGNVYRITEVEEHHAEVQD